MKNFSDNNYIKSEYKKIKLLNTYGFSSVSLFRQNIKYISF